MASPIKFQADMGILLAFMFLWNMVGALILVPALGYFLITERALDQTANRTDSASYSCNSQLPHS